MLKKILMITTLLAACSTVFAADTLSETINAKLNQQPHTATQSSAPAFLYAGNDFTKNQSVDYLS